MSKLKDITKELTGRALSPFHRKTGLNQLERNNEMQDGILDGILSQVDDAYITKAEQSNVMHLEGSGDGVVVIDSIEGNTAIGLIKKSNAHVASQWLQISSLIKPITNSKITIRNNTNKDIRFQLSNLDNSYKSNTAISAYSTRVIQIDNESKFRMMQGHPQEGWSLNTTDLDYFLNNVCVLEGDWTDKEIPSDYFEGLQSSFEEKVNDEGKHEIEILSVNKGNLFNGVVKKQVVNTLGQITPSENGRSTDYIKVFGNTDITIRAEKYNANRFGILEYDSNKSFVKFNENSNVYTANGYTFRTQPNTKYIIFYYNNDTAGISELIPSTIVVNVGASTIYNIPLKSNRIKILLNEPLRAVGDVKDRLCVRDGRLVVERLCGEIKAEEHLVSVYDNHPNAPNSYCLFKINQGRFKTDSISNKLNFVGDALYKVKSVGDYYLTTDSHMWVAFDFNTKEEYKNYCKEHNIKIVSILAEPIYEEVTNEYGEPILLEGYENGTLYIDSTITPTTTVRYTPKMEAFSVCNEIQENNVALSSDINDNIITYMMEVDYMITEKELNSASVCSVTQRMEVLDMTSMQKRTFDMLARLFKGKTLTKEECETRVTVYLSAGKITDEQAEELMLLIAETYQ